MEAATLSSPQRNYDTVPVQKSLSLPSYARAGGEGIDHRLIFAALEQREKVRRKSRIFTREKTARQNIFCLPISSGAKCRETSFSSDTSCSSLEYQKPKKDSSKPKKDEAKLSKIEKTTVSEVSTAKTSQFDTKTTQPDTKTNLSPKDVSSRNGDMDQDLQQNPLRTADYYRKDHRSPSETLRANVHSSDSMDRSSRSSNDSLSRKERLVAIKAKVEAAREKYGDTSSEEENRGTITRYNSDGVIHRTVKEVKSRSYRLEKRLRRRSQDEYAMRKIYRKNNLSLCLNSTEDGIKMDLYNSPLSMFEDHQNLECKTDFCPSPNFLDLTKKSYFSDFPTKENMTRMVQARIRQIEEEERKRRNSVDLRDKNRFSSRQSPQNTENSSPFSTQRRNVFSNDNVLSNSNVEKNSPCSDALQCPSPVGRAPTPPPRSPKSMSFVNKAYMQHQNSCLNHDSRSLERKPFYKPNIPVSKSFDICKTDITANDSKPDSNILDDSAERHKMRELFNARRKTCSHFDYNEDFGFKDLSSKPETPTLSNSTVITTNASSSLSSPKSSDTKGYFSGNETPSVSSEDPKRRLWRNKWEETEKRHEFLFNSLESKKKVMSPTWSKFSGISQKNDTCLCHILSGDKSICTCNHNNRNPSTNSPILSKIESFSNYANLKELEGHETRNRLSKSEVNIAYSDKPKCKIQNLISGNLFNDLQLAEKKSSKIKPNGDHEEKLSATANLDSAMEELESVYRSLKFSSDTLSEKNSASNLSLNDLNAETSHKKLNGNCITDTHPKSYSVKENNFNFYENKPYKVKPVFNKAQDFPKPSVYSTPIDIPINTTCKSTDSENICIDELFNDLTRQLDIEQKLLKETRDHRTENRTVELEADKCDIQDQKRMTPLESIVSIRKELYNNLQKDSREPVRSYNYVSKGINYQQNPPLEITKKKYKAVRSLSENISYLMTAANTSPTPSRKMSIDKFEPSICNMETVLIEKSSPKHYEHVALEPPKLETKREVSLHQPIVPKRTFVSDRLKKHGEEIRQIRVSMDSNASEAKTVPKIPLSDYPRLSSAVCRQQVSPKSESRVCMQHISPNSEPRSLQHSNNAPKESIDVLDENGLEKLLNTLLNDVPDTKQSSLLLSSDHLSSTPPPPAASAGKSDHVKIKRSILPSRMEAYMAAAAAQNPVTECTQRLKSEDIAQVKNDFRQNNAHLNQMSFIPVYSSKTVCHKFPKSNENQCESPPERKVLSTYSPPSRPRCVAGNNDVASRFTKPHMRRRSVGFEDMTSFTCYGHNFTNDRFQGSVHNSNIPQPHSENHSIFFNPSSTPPLGKMNQSESSCFSSLNHNSQLSSGENANDQMHRRTERPLHRYKDKSSKRKSSLNRIDFIQFPSNSGNTHCHSDQSQQHNSSSDDGSESKLHVKMLESPSGTAKRKHSSNHALSKSEVKTNEITLSNSSPAKAKSNMLPRSLLNQLSPRPNRWRHSSTIRFSQKLSHSAGELESLTDLSEVPSTNKTYLSAQEYDDPECSRISLDSNISRAVTRNSIPMLSPQHLNKSSGSILSKGNICDSTSQVEIENKSEKDVEPSKLSTSIDLTDYGDTSQPADPRDISSRACSEQITMTSDPSNSVCDDSNEHINAEIDASAIRLENLEFTDESKTMDIYLSADENGEVAGSDGRRRPSILRKKSFEEKKELHSILKPPPDDKLSKTPPSILKHRESSEEKEIWQSNDLHSILKKSTSEEDSCNSGSDIRPILKLSTDEDSPCGSVRPRPILKKRTSFSDECSYVSFPSGELKPILKKKTLLSSEDQPRPILKCRRKSEDTRSTSEVITSRPRAYSADMGVKLSHEGQTESSEIKDFQKLDSHDL